MCVCVCSCHSMCVCVRTCQVRVRDWTMTGEHTVIGIVRVAVSDVVENIESSWFHLESPSGTGFVGHHGEATEIKLAFQSEAVLRLSKVRT
jgi:hypothetical protein